MKGNTVTRYLASSPSCKKNTRPSITGGQPTGLSIHGIQLKAPAFLCNVQESLCQDPAAVLPDLET